MSLRDRSRRVLPALLIVVLSLAFAASARAVPPFERVTLATGLDMPTAVAFAPDGRMFVTEKEGRVRVVSPEGVLRAQPLLDISDHVASFGDRGLLGIAVDAQYPTHPYLYLLYTREHEPELPEGPKESVLTRVELGADNGVGPETVVLGGAGVPCRPGADCIPAPTAIHAIGTVRSAPDGTLWVGNGDGGAALKMGSAESLQTYDPDSYRGKILHVQRDGSPVPGHPYCPGATDDRICAKVFATGFRNPFRFALRPAGGVTLGDVGEQHWEEINTVAGPGNHGWPCYEGQARTPGHQDTAGCQAQYAKGRAAFSFPTHVYSNLGPTPGPRASVVGGPAYDGAAYPAGYAGLVMYADTIRGWLKGIRLGGAGQVLEERELLPGGTLGYPTDLVEGPAALEGDLVVTELGAGRVSRIRYAPFDRTPIPEAAASPRFGRDVTEIAFSSQGSHDPFGQPITYAWDFGDGATSTEANPTHTYAPGAYVARLTVTDPGGRSATGQIAVFPGHDPPEVEIDAPQDGDGFDAGDRIALAGWAADDEDAALTGTALEWDVQLHHADHVHFLGPFRGGQAGFRTLRSHDADSWYEIALTASDGRGMSATAEPVALRPRTSPVRLRSDPPGAPLSYDTRPGAAPWDVTAARGFEAPVSAAAEFVAGGRTWRFERWSNGGGQTQVVRIPRDGLTLTAIYTTEQAPGPVDVGVPPPFTETPILEGPARDVTGPTVRVQGANARRLTGVATDDAGIASVRLALRRSGGRGCRYWSLSTRRLSQRRRCAAPIWHSARLGRVSGATRRWTLNLRGGLPPGRYEALVRAADTAGNVAERWAGGRRTTRLRIPRT